MDLRFIFDTGASNISISKSEAITLLKQGTLTEDDIIDIQEFQDATGAISVGTRINLKEVQIGSQILTDVEAIVVDNPYAPLLLGQSVLERFSNIKIDNRNNQIIFEN
jgi:aspartyl protease family protein